MFVLGRRFNERIIIGGLISVAATHLQSTHVRVHVTFWSGSEQHSLHKWLQYEERFQITAEVVLFIQRKRGYKDHVTFFVEAPRHISVHREEIQAVIDASR